MPHYLVWCIWQEQNARILDGCMEILARGAGVRGGKHNILCFLCAEHLYRQQCSNMKNSL